MCYNCGCGMPDEDHGNPKNITNKTFEDAALVNNQIIEEAKQNTHDLLMKEFDYDDEEDEEDEEGDTKDDLGEDEEED